MTATASARRAQLADAHAVSNISAAELATNKTASNDLFLDPMMGAPLTIYIEKDVPDKDLLTDLIIKHGGAISPGYSGVPYILVDPQKESGQNLYRQYAGKKGKIVLDARWVHECVSKNELQTFQHNWAGCKVAGTESLGPRHTTPTSSTAPPPRDQLRRQSRQGTHPAQHQVVVLPRAIQNAPPLHPHQPSIPGPTMPAAVDSLVHASNAYPYAVYDPSLQPAPRSIHPTAPPQAWPASNGIAPQQTHMQPPPAMLPRPVSYREDAPWDNAYTHASSSASSLVGGHDPSTYDYRYTRDDQSDQWVGEPSDFYDPSYDQYDQGPAFINEPGPSNQGLSSNPADSPDKPRGRKRTKIQATSGAPASSLVVNSGHPPARSPTPPTRVIKSTYGGNLFTADDVLYLKKYIDYCQEEGLVLSLREICERIAVKAPHHTFYSWRRYCNKHQIRLGGYAMTDRPPTPNRGDQDQMDEEDALHSGPDAGVIPMARLRIAQDGESGRGRSPTPPRALFRSTTGKGVAFTDEDVQFLVRFMDHRRSQGRLDMVAFWKDVAARAPHHSRASWMKYWRRHKHELNHTETDDPLPHPPEKKMRYSREDDILLAKYFFSKPEGTSDKIFQAFGRLHPHHPWKGWQEHHRIHKAKIDHLVQQLANGDNIDAPESSAE